MRSGAAATAAKGCGGGCGSAPDMKTRLGANSIGAAALVGAIAMPVTPPLDSGATPSARHWLCSSVENSAARGNDAQATVLHRSASTPALFHPKGHGNRDQPGVSDRLSGRAWLRGVNTRP